MKRYFIVALVFNFVLLLNAFSYADQAIYKNNLNGCELTDAYMNDYEPEKFSSINNLLRHTGKAEIFCGDKIVIQGRVLDEHCVPVSDAKVYLWQVGCDGKYPYKALRNSVNPAMLNLDNGSSFTGSGVATTNNKGEFLFVTIYPATPAHSKEAPHVNIRIEHKHLGALQTKFYPSEQNGLGLCKYPVCRIPLDDFTTQSVHRYGTDIVLQGDSNRRY